MIVLLLFTCLTCKHMACEAVNYNAGKMIVFAQFTIAGSWEIAAMVQRDADMKVIEITPTENSIELTPMVVNINQVVVVSIIYQEWFTQHFVFEII